MRPSAVAPLAALLLAVAAPARSQTPSPVVVASPASAIAATATGEEQITPDRARVSIGVQTRAATAALAATANARLQRAVIDTLRALGFATDQLTTSGYNVYPEQRFDQPSGRARITGYNVQNTVVVEVRRMDQVGPVLDAVLARGANQISSLQFYSSQAEAARRRALARAVERARADAEAMAQAAGGQLGELLELNAGHQPPRPQPALDMAVARMAAESAPTPISEGSQTISATVHARWRFVGTR